jgi:hypothetical protein
MAEINLRVLDTRIGGRFNRPKSTDIIVGSTTPLGQVVDRIVTAVGSNKLRTLSICCHGYEAGVADERAAMSYNGGGFGLELGGDNLTWDTVSAFSPLYGKFASGAVMDVYSCAAAQDSSGGQGFTGNGRLLMRELAGYIGAIVRASDTPQEYTAGVVDLYVVSWYEGVDFGEWEGNVWLFHPDGSRTLDKNPGQGVS